MNLEVRTAVPTFSGEVAGVVFRDGVGVVTGQEAGAIAYFRSTEGYTLSPTDAEPFPPSPMVEVARNYFAHAEDVRAVRRAIAEDNRRQPMFPLPPAWQKQPMCPLGPLG